MSNQDIFKNVSPLPKNNKTKQKKKKTKKKNKTKKKAKEKQQKTKKSDLQLSGTRSIITARWLLLSDQIAI